MRTLEGLGASLVALVATASAQELAEPVRLRAGGEFIDTDIGHAAPYVTDFDRDGKRDLLVGQFGDGKLKIFRNVGTNTEPEYAGVEWFHAGGKLVKVPTG